MILQKLTFDELFTLVDNKFENDIEFLMRNAGNRTFSTYAGIRRALDVASIDTQGRLTVEQAAVVYDCVNIGPSPCSSCGAPYSCCTWGDTDQKICSFCRLINIQMNSRVQTEIRHEPVYRNKEPAEDRVFAFWWIDKNEDMEGQIDNFTQIQNEVYPSKLLSIIRKDEIKASLSEIVLYDNLMENRLNALSKIDDVEVIIDILKKVDYRIPISDGSLHELIPLIVDKIKDEKILKRIIDEVYDQNILKSTTEKISDIIFLEDQAINALISSVRKTAVEKIDNYNIIQYLSKYDNDMDVRETAKTRLRQIKPTPRKSIPSKSAKISSKVGKSKKAIFLDNYKKKKHRTLKEEWLNRNYFTPPYKTSEKQKVILKDTRGREFDGSNIYFHVILYELIFFTGILFIVGFLQYRTIYYDLVLGFIESISDWDLSWVNVFSLVIYGMMLRSIYMFFMLPESRIGKLIGVLLTVIIWIVSLNIVSGVFGFDPNVYYLAIAGYLVLSSLIAQLNIPEGVLSVRYEKA